MKTVLVIFQGVIFFIYANLNAQFDFELQGRVNKNISSSIKEGSKVKLIRLYEDEINSTDKATLIVNGKEEMEETVIHYKIDTSENNILDLSGNKIVDKEEKVI